MDLTNLTTIKGLLTHYNLSAQKSLGQHFLIDRESLESVVAAAELTPRDFVVEVGPGFGVLTVELCQRAGRVLAIETDKNMIRLLTSITAENDNLEILNSNILRVQHSEIYQLYRRWADAKEATTSYKVVSNLPYYITSAIVKFFLEAAHRPKSMVLMVQKEVAERIVAEPGEMSILAISVQVYAKAAIVRLVPKTSFWPKPEVISAIIKIEPYDNSPYEIDDMRKFFRVVKAGFAEKRKQLHNSLGGGLQLEDEDILELMKKANIDAKLRPQDLKVSDWVVLYDLLKAHI